MGRKARRLELDAMFKELTPHVYFQPPASVVMKYPAIRYKLSGDDVTYADNIHYLDGTTYQVMVIDADPDSEIAEAISKFPYCRLNASYAVENLNHFVYTIYY